jgi:phenylalanine-4-hydroxylase
MKTIPDYLVPYVATQDSSLYTPMDHAGWRFILKISKAFFSKHAHEMYLDGLEKTGISTEHIPDISEMDSKLKNFGWRAVPVCGFIPPSVFMEFLSLGVLPIACDMRKHEHLSYTPAPDVVHEAAGHAPIIADPEYAHYLKQYGEISRKAIFSSQDWNVYVAIRNLSDIKENPQSTLQEIQASQKSLDAAIEAIDHVSEATQLARMSWWTIEYGLIGPLEDPKIYGAGLLSSLSESYQCLSSKIPKIPLTVACVDRNYDITKPQPQLYIAPSFQTLTNVLEELSEKMAYRTGGIEGLKKARKAATVTTSVLEGGLQISGILDDFILDDHQNPILLKFQGPIQLSIEDQELPGLGASRLIKGWVTPMGPAKFSRNKNLDKVIFDSGFIIQGKFIKEIKLKEKTVALVFENCSLTGPDMFSSKIHRTYPLREGVFAWSNKVVSVFGGAADRTRFLADTGGFQQSPRVQKTNLTPSNQTLNELYQSLRDIRERRSAIQERSKMNHIQEELDRSFPGDWLLRLELLELNSIYSLNASWERDIHERLRGITASSPAISEMIDRGLALL